MRLHWNELSITTKFGSVFFALLFLVVIVALTNFTALNLVTRQTEETIASSIEIQRLVLQMESSMQNARLVQKDFFLQWPRVGYEKARDIYATKNSALVDEVISLSENLRLAIANSDVSVSLRESKVDLNLFLSAASRNKEAFAEAVQYVAEAASEKTGAQSRLSTVSKSIYLILREVNELRPILTYREMQLLEKDYLITRERPYIQSAFNVGSRIYRIVWASSAFTGEQRSQITELLKRYQDTANELIELDFESRSLIKEFELEDEVIGAISEELVSLAEAEVLKGRDSIRATSRFSMLLVVAAVVAAFILVALIGVVLNRSFTRNVVELNSALNQLQSGDLDARAAVNSGDEIGRLSQGFNSMVRGLKERELIRNLFGKVVPDKVAEEMLKQPDGLRPQKEIATILFSDLASFTSMSEEADPSDIVDLLNEYFTEMTEIIQSHHGIVAQFQGDAILAVFNVPVADELHARNAINAARVMTDTVLNKAICGRQLSCRIGINTGEVVAGNVGASDRMNYTVHGDAVNLAARLEQLNKEYSTITLISGATIDLIGKDGFKELGSVSIRGRMQPVQIYTFG